MSEKKNSDSNNQKNSFWKLCQQAVDMTIDEGPVLEGFTIERMYKKLKDIVSLDEWDKEYFFRIAAIFFMEVYLNKIGYRCGKRKSGVFFHEKIHNKIMRTGYAIQEQQLADSYQAKADELTENANIVIVDDSGIDGQGNIFGEIERTISAWIEEIKRIESK